MEFIENLKYTKNHEWLKVEGDVATIGVTDYAQQELGDIVFVDIDSIGSNLSQDDVFGSIEAVKTVSDLFMPLSGEVTEMNTDLESNPELINTSPYNDGWIIKVKVHEIDESKLLNMSEYKAHLGL
ncbi:MAG: glycine cleavage system protein H [Flavobacteriales bacterium]|nr:glycine cleavage system protein H [Flavobacteriales bacterium]|tara:strand:- start:772 stop:1149 length:378 start_codon:yes stop_codon:yes gene_type:complete